MTNALRNSIHQMAAEFAASVLTAIRGASLEDILTETRGSTASPSPAPSRGVNGYADAGAAVRRGPGRPRKVPVAADAPRKASSPAAGRVATRTGSGDRLGRRSAENITGVIARIVELLEGHPDGLRAEQIRDALHLQAKELPRPIAKALEGRKISKTGEKRATTYYAGAGRGRAPAAASRGGKSGRTVGKAAGAAGKRANRSEAASSDG